MHQVNSPTRLRIAASELMPVRHRISCRLRGISPQCGLVPPATSEVTTHKLSTTTMNRESNAQGTVVFYKTEILQAFKGDLFEGAEGWLVYFECVECFNQWYDASKQRNVYFSLEYSARTCCDNTEATPLTWQNSRHHCLQPHASTDHREKAEGALQFCVQLPNGSVSL